MIARTDDFDLTITFSWADMPMPMCGHLFEAIEYFWILKDHFKTCIFIGSRTTREFLQTAIEDKYDFSPVEVQEILSSMIFADNPSILKGNNLLLVDAGFEKLKDKTLIFKNIAVFPCNDLSYQTKDCIPLADSRIYSTPCIDYKKKILFSRYKPIFNESVDYLVYATKYQRELNMDIFKELSQKYFGYFLVLSEEKFDLHSRFTQETPPCKNLMEKFGTYIYTPTMFKRDCSSRFLAECKYYNKDIIFHGVDYWDGDLGLKHRWNDILYNFKSLYLEPDDEIIPIIKAIINN